MSLVMRKPDFCICENKDTDQLRGNCEADQRLCFHYMDSTIPLLSKTLAIFCGCTDRFVCDLVGNPEDRFSHNEAQIAYETDHKPCREKIYLWGSNTDWQDRNSGKIETCN